jgi:hypothetical protein
METVTGLNGKPVDVVVDPAERVAQGLPEKIDSSEYHLGTAGTYLSEADSRIYDVRKEAEALAERVVKAEFAVDYDRVAAGLKFIELQGLVLAEGYGWEKWFAGHVRGINIRTAQRYMRLARQDETLVKAASGGRFKSRAKDVAVGDDSTVSPEDAPTEASGEREESLSQSPRRRLATLVSKLSESEAEQVLAIVMKWRSKR